MDKHQYLANYIQSLEQARAKAAAAPLVNQIPTAVQYVPLVEQIRAVLCTLPPAQTQRISIAWLLPHLRGKYRPAANHVKVAQALRQLGYTSKRSWKVADRNTRVWVKQSF